MSLLSYHHGSPNKSSPPTTMMICQPTGLGKRPPEPLPLPPQNKKSRVEFAAAPPTATRRVACKARNMPNSHYEDTAYFDIPFNAKHGMLLACSHPACSGGGTRRRFRYCAVCHVPVSKRNFVKRHSHGMLTDRTVLPSAVSLSSSDSEPEETNQVTPDPNTTPPAPPAETPTKPSPELAVPDPIETQSEPVPTEREKQWLSLLHTCPPDADVSAMDAWMRQVISVARPKETSTQLSPVTDSTVAQVEEPPDAAEVSDSEGSDSTTPEDYLSLAGWLEHGNEQLLLPTAEAELADADLDPLRVPSTLF
mmetsp:Transcript_169/g.420  ORF Transcript_169/g.420 Transcript_169/m.420 type:complete len:308 (-) Transcript_169:94-1017(-)